jgi:hypothetical protein
MDAVHTPGRLRSQPVKVHTPACHDCHDGAQVCSGGDPQANPSAQLRCAAITRSVSTLAEGG